VTDANGLVKAAPAPLRAWINPALVPSGCIGTAPEGMDPEEHIRQAEAWLIGQGCHAAQGPMDGSTWMSYRANLGPQDRPPFLAEPTADPTPWTASGYTIIAKYASALADNLEQAESAEKRSCRLVTAGWDLVNLTDMGGFQAVLPLFWRLSNASFAHAFAFSPIQYAQFQALYAPLESIIDPHMVTVAKSPDGEPAGFCFTIPDLLNPDRKEFIVKTICVDPKYRKEGIGSWMVGAAHSVAHARGWTAGGIHALMWSGSHSRSISQHSGVLLREYALFHKTLVSDGNPTPAPEGP